MRSHPVGRLARGGAGQQRGDDVRLHDLTGLDDWLRRATSSEIPIEMRRFASGIQTDLAAVQGALRLPWSNGQTEGQVNRLKLIKRLMYGRAKFDLLRQRVLAKPA
jgi:transposase